MPDTSERTRIQLCGRLSVELDGAELVQRLRGRQVPLLLAYLVLSRRRPVAREELVGALWPAAPPRAEDAAIRTLLSRLRSALGPGVVTGRDELILALPEPVWVDVEAAAAELSRAQHALDSGDARTAWALVQVPLNIAGRGLLTGIEADWLAAPRRELADVKLQALEAMGHAGLLLGGTQLGSAQRAARALIEAEPYRESGYVLLMDALRAQGNAAEALRVFERLRALLRDDLGTAPSPEALAAHERLLHPPLRARSGPRPEQGRSRSALAAELRGAAVTPLVGRAAQLTALERWWADPEAEPMLLLRGEPGIGKTRLLAELAVRAHGHGAAVLAGRSPDEAVVPYQPFLEALGQYVLQAPIDELRRVSGEHAPELSRLVVALTERLPELPQRVPGDPETDRWRLFEAVAGLLERVSEIAPVLIVLDDLHWADRPALLLLRHLVRSPRCARVRVVAAYRAMDRSSEGFEAALTGLHREQLARQLEIPGLAEEETAELVSQRIGGFASSELVAALHRLSEGNPFFIRQLLTHLADAGVLAADAGARELEAAGLPDDVREVISRRLGRLERATLDWLRAASVIGRDFDSQLLQAVDSRGEQAFLAALDDALQAGLVHERPGATGSFSFSHQLIRETLYESMSGARRASIHHRVADALERLGDEARIGALAMHLARAGDPHDSERTIRYSLAAGFRATEVLAHEEAAGHFARALEALQRQAPDDLGRRLELLLELGEARVRGGDRRLAWVALREAAELADRIGDREALARAAVSASRPYLQPPGVVDEQLIGLLEHALELTAGERSLVRARLLHRLCGALYFSDRRELMESLSVEATELAAELETPEATALAAAARRRASWAPATPDGLAGRLAESTAVLRAAREASDAELTLQGHAWLVVDLLETGDRRGVEAQIEAFTAGADQLRQPLYLWNAAVWRAMLALLDGRLDDAERLAGEAASLGVRIEGVTAPQYYAIQMLAVRREQDRMGELEQAARALVSSNPGRPAWRAGLAMLLQASGRADQARAELRELASDGFAWARDGDWIVAGVLAASVAAELEDREHAEPLYQLLAPYAAAHAVVGLGAVCLGSTSGPLGRLAAVLGRRDDAVDHLRAALEANGALRAAVELAHAQIDLAAALGPGPEAEGLLARALAAGERLEWPSVVGRVRRLGSPSTAGSGGDRD